MKLFLEDLLPQQKNGASCGCSKSSDGCAACSFEAVFGGESQIYFPWNPGRTGPGSTPGASIVWPIRRLLSIKHPRFRSCSWASGSSSRSWRWVCSPSPGNFPSLGGQSTPPCLLGEGESLPNFSSSYGNARVPGDATCNRCKCISWTKTLFSLWSVFTSLDFEKFEQNCIEKIYFFCHSHQLPLFFWRHIKTCIIYYTHTYTHTHILFDILDSPRPQQQKPPFGRKVLGAEGAELA